MSAAAHDARVSPAGNSGDDVSWFEARPGIEIKVLAADAVARTAEYLARMPAGYHTGPYRHRADTFVYVLSGQLCVAATSALYQAGDYCCQPAGVLHDQLIGPEGATVYVNQRAVADRLVDFLDANGAVADVFRITDFARHAPVRFESESRA